MQKNILATVPAVVLLAILVFATGCTSSTLSHQDLGMAIGSIAGGVAGSQFGGDNAGRAAATIIGTMTGAYVGGQLGRAMDERDRFKTQLALERNHSQQPSSWVNPDSGNSYTVVPTRTYQGQSGACRDYTTKAFIGGRTEVVHGTACRQPNGSWRTTG
ncbi:MAG: hypothetical protein A2286_04060 [Gammaproteobacteria bacterium RIFOXYA12_FULL_61_12]|nr:MAG: hypothetical protein A2286_04060 [Gammaproteobacteria bacterium RIFOXYA12_FULL_61_12]OGT90150.1 MAG: hypothetical protein A2514_11515 [Gammaproteobacteria bacterium RIFOXYD12_FULL_61_37]